MSKDQTVEQVSMKSLNKKIDGLITKHSAWRVEVQEVLVQCSYHAHEHNNVDGFTRVVGVLKGADMKAIIKWVQKHGRAVWHKTEGRFTLNKSDKGAFDAAFLMEAEQAWWTTATEAKDVKLEFDVLEAVQAMIKRAEREVTAKANIKTIKNLELLKDVRRTVTEYEESMKPQIITIEVDDDAALALATGGLKQLKEIYTH
jgi:hypothetical protein